MSKVALITGITAVLSPHISFMFLKLNLIASVSMTT